MKVYDYRLGRLGNAIFRYFASTLFCILYGAKRTYNRNELNATINDQMFINWMNDVLNDNIPNIGDLNYNFYGYFQHDKIFLKFKNELLLWIKNNGEELLYTDGNDQYTNNYNYNVQSYKAYDLIHEPPNINKYDVVVHLRLEDFIVNNDVIHPDCIINILKKLDYKSYCLVLNKPKNDIELQYVDYIKKNIDFDINLQTGTVIEDFHVMKNAKVLICSCSTLSWIASFMSDTVETVYFPNKSKESHETFCKPIENTIYYDIIKCNKTTLENLFNTNQNNYCIMNYKNEPITDIIYEHIKDIKNGIYVNIGDHGLIKYLEKLNWSCFNTYNGKIDLLSINSEGSESELLKKYKPVYLLITIYKENKNKVFEIIDKNNFVFLENITDYNTFDNPNWDQKYNIYLFKNE